MFLFNLIFQFFTGLILSGTVAACSAVVPLLFALIIACKLVNRRPPVQVLALPMSETYQQIIPYMPRILTIYACRDIVLYATRAMVVFQTHPAVANSDLLSLVLKMLFAALWMIDLIISGFQTIQTWVGMFSCALGTAVQAIFNFILRGFNTFQAWVRMSIHALGTAVQAICNFILSGFNTFQAWVGMSIHALGTGVQMLFNFILSGFNAFKACWVFNDNKDDDDVAPANNTDTMDPAQQAYLEFHLKNRIDWTQVIDQLDEERTRRELARMKLGQKERMQASSRARYTKWYQTTGVDPNFIYKPKAHST